MKNIISIIRNTVATAIAIAACAFATQAQQSAPRTDQLLNGLRIAVFSDPAAAKVTVKTRIHSGSAFDPAEKEGVMKLLSEIIFPSDSAREFFRDDLGGNLEIECNYDYIEITASGNSDKFLTILETLASALTNPQITKETTERVKAPHLAKLAELEKDPAYVADVLALRRLLGGYPYGRPVMGSAASVGKIDFADILFAKQRFLTSDNATIAIGGNVKADFALRATRRLFGGWLKSDRLVPATFAQPAAPDPKIQVSGVAAENVSELRYATRGAARSDKDYFAFKVAEKVLASRVASKFGPRSFVRFDGRFLPGTLTIGIGAWEEAKFRVVNGSASLPSYVLDYPVSLTGGAVTADEFERSKGAVTDEAVRRDPIDYFLDSHTYKFVSVKDDQAKLASTSLADAQRVMNNLKSQPFATVVVLTSGTQPANQ